MKKYIKIKLKENPTCSITAVIEDNDARYQHPLTGSLCESVEQIFTGWSEQNEDSSLQWDELQRRIERCDLIEACDCEDEEIALEIDEHGMLYPCE